MDDFRVGSVPSPDPYGSRRPSDAVNRRRRHHDDGGRDESPDEPQDIFDAAPVEEAPSSVDEPVEDYYLPSDSGDPKE